MERKNKEYSEEFKKMIVELYEQGRKPTELIREYGIVSERSIYTWAKKYSKIQITKGEKTSEITLKDYEKLQKQYKEAQLENEILKKAVAIFTKK